MNDIPSILTDITIGKSDEFLTLSREIMELSYNRIPSLAPGGKRPRMELPPDPHHVLPIKHLAALLHAASDRAHFSYLLRGCLLVDLRGGAVVGPQQLLADIEAVWVLLHSVKTIVAPIG
jgi:hypothetical protein